jgi:hypothetical protein
MLKEDCITMTGILLVSLLIFCNLLAEERKKLGF